MPLLIVEHFQCALLLKKGFTSMKIVVIINASRCFLSSQTSADLNFIKINVKKRICVKPAKPGSFTTLGSNRKIPPRLKPLINEYDEVFYGTGKLTDVQVHLYINEEGFRLLFKRKLKVNYTTCTSPIVALPKPSNSDKIRLCVDMCQTNAAILQEHYPRPTIDDFIKNLNGV